MILSALLVFLATAAADAVWAHYVSNVAAGHPVRSGVFAAGVILAGSFVTISYVTDHWMLLPAAVGAFVGTWATVRLQRGHVTPTRAS